MVNVKEMITSEYITVEMVKEGHNKVPIVAKPKEREGSFGNYLEIQFQIKGEIKKFSAYTKSIINLSSAYGEESDEWLSKLVELKIEKNKNDKDVIIAYPLEE